VEVATDDVGRGLERVYRQRYDAVCRLATAVTGDVERAHEAVQEGFARAWRARGGFRDDGSLEGWVRRIVLRCALDRGRESLDEPITDDVPLALPFPDRNPALAAAVARLAPRRRLVVFLRYYADLETTRIAEVLGIARGTVSATLVQAHAELRAALAETEEVQR
jgi:RNA polymerase sigma-70 factor (ECF subfamily)